LLRQLDASLNALPEKLANILAEQKPARPAPTTTAKQETKTETTEVKSDAAPSSAGKDPWDKRFQRFMFGGSA
jgi:hypothetical protein